MSATNEPSSSNPTEAINCPSCGGTVDYPRGATSIKCHYCGQAIRIPQADSVESIPRNVFTVMDVTPTTPQSRGASAGCVVLVVGFVVFMVLVTVVLPIVLTNQALSNIPEMPSAIKELATAAYEAKSAVQEPTRRPATPIPTPTPAFANIAMQFGEKGIGPGQFTNAHAGGVDSDDHVYVGEYVGGRVQVFDATGKLLKQFFVGDKHTDLLGFAVDRNGVVYVADGADITRWDGKTGKSLGKLKYSGGPGFGELALAPDGSLYAMWYERRNGIFTSLDGAREDLVRFDSSGKVSKVLPGVISSQTDNLELDNALAVDGRGNVYVTPSAEGAIFKFDPNGKFITRIGSSGDGSSQFGSLGAIAVDGQGRLTIDDSSEIKVLKPDGSLLGSIEVPGAARSLVFDEAGALWVTTDDQVLKYQIKQK